MENKTIAYILLGIIFLYLFGAPSTIGIPGLGWDLSKEKLALLKNRIFGEKEPPQSTEPIPQKKTFDYSKVSITDLKPVISPYYSNSTQMVCYKLNNPSSNTNDSFSLIGEWFDSDKKIPEEPGYEEPLFFSNISPLKTWYNWHFFDSIEKDKTRFRASL